MKVAVIGAGWAGCAAAVEATRLGHDITLYEAARIPGGRARRVDSMLDGQALTVDNGQHILIGAYTETLRLMKDLGVEIDTALLRLPLTLQFPDGDGLSLPDWPAPIDALAGILTARGWALADKLSLLQVAIGWQLGGFRCEPGQSVKSLCQKLTPSVMTQLVEPLCVSALNTPVDRASGEVFLRVLRDSMFAGSGGSNLLLPRVDLSSLLPEAALSWLGANGGTSLSGARVQGITAASPGWVVSCDNNSASFDHIVLACPSPEAARLVTSSGVVASAWLTHTRALQFEALTTVYAHAHGARLGQPMLALRSNAQQPAQFVFDRGQLNGPLGLMAFVISASVGDGATLTRQVLAQAAKQLKLGPLKAIQTIVEKRATFACTPGMHRPEAHIADGLIACGDYVAGPYPATLEGAVRSGLEAARSLHRIPAC